MMDCIVIGGGASGLMAANDLLTHGYRVRIIEARDRLGGRICTLSKGNFSRPLEIGAEFLHGELPLTSALLARAGVSWRAAGGEAFQVHKGTYIQRDFFNGEWSLLLQKLKEVTHDMTFAEFLQQKFPTEEFGPFRDKIRRFVEGYNAASVDKASAFALRREWLQNEEPKQYRPDGGYGKLIAYLSDKILEQKGVIRLSEIVEEIIWKPGSVKVRTRDGKLYESEKVVVTLPIGVLRRNPVRISPQIPEYLRAAGDFGFGSVLKVHLEFREPFWEKTHGRKTPGLGFMFSDAEIPTWWSQLPDEAPVLTGWLGGPAAEKIPPESQRVLTMAFNSLSYALKHSVPEIKSQLKAWNIANWHADPFSLGAYSFVALETRSARKTLGTPVSDTIYFAGEGLYDGPHTGTVEAALHSGSEVAEKITGKPAPLFDA